MRASLPRRHALRGAAFATVAAGASVPAAAAPPADAALAALNEVQRAAWEAVRAADDIVADIGSKDPRYPAADAASRRASETWDAVIGRMAEAPAEGMLGLAIKAAIVARDQDECGGLSDAGMQLAESLFADIARLAPPVTP